MGVKGGGGIFVRNSLSPQCSLTGTLETKEVEQNKIQTTMRTVGGWWQSVVTLEQSKRVFPIDFPCIQHLQVQSVFNLFHQWKWVCVWGRRIFPPLHPRHLLFLVCVVLPVWGRRGERKAIREWFLVNIGHSSLPLTSQFHSDDDGDDDVRSNYSSASFNLFQFALSMAFFIGKLSAIFQLFHLQLIPFTSLFSHKVFCI